jgi:hypothetical protein
MENLNFNTNTKNNDEWLTPPEIIKSLGVFDLDPCSSIIRPWNTAIKHYNINDDGLNKKREGVSMIKQIIKTYKGWAINANSKEGHGLLGRYYWNAMEIPPHMEGHHVAVFCTRDLARKALPDVKFSFPKAKIERVTIDISTE